MRSARTLRCCLTVLPLPVSRCESQNSLVTPRASPTHLDSSRPISPTSTSERHHCPTTTSSWCRSITRNPHPLWEEQILQDLRPGFRLRNDRPVAGVGRPKGVSPRCGAERTPRREHERGERATQRAKRKRWCCQGRRYEQPSSSREQYSQVASYSYSITWGYCLAKPSLRTSLKMRSPSHSLCGHRSSTM